MSASGVRTVLEAFIDDLYERLSAHRFEEVLAGEADDLDGQRTMTETANSSVKRSFGSDVRAREWYREFHEIVLMCLVYNIKQYVIP